MQTVADDTGTRYLLLKRSSDAWLVRDPESGTDRHLPVETLAVVDGTSPLGIAARGVPSAVEAAVSAPSERAIGLLAEIRRREPVSVRTLLTDYALCESDLHGILAEFRAAGLIAETRVAGERGYETTAALAERWD